MFEAPATIGALESERFRSPVGAHCTPSADRGRQLLPCHRSARENWPISLITLAARRFPALAHFPAFSSSLLSAKICIIDPFFCFFIAPLPRLVRKRKRRESFSPA